MKSWRQRAFGFLLVCALTLTLLFLTLPVLALFVESTPAQLLESLTSPISRDALLISLKTTLAAITIVVVFGTPTAYFLATRRFRGRELLITMIELPLVLPPAVAGIGLLVALGPNSPIGGLLEDAGVELVLQTAGVVVALTFVSAPFYIRQAQTAVQAVDPQLIDASRTLGVSEAKTVVRIVLPTARSGMAAGLALAWGRALGEFGATLMFAGSFRGVTQTIPLAIYDRFSVDLPAAVALSALLVAVSAALLLTVKLLGREPGGRGA